MYAVVKTGGKQYRVSEGDQFKVEKLDAKVGAKLTLDHVLMIGHAEPVHVGTPLVSNASVDCEVLEQGRADKITVFKKKRRKRYRRKLGHRQPFTLLQVTSITIAGTKAKATPKKAAPVKKKPMKKVTVKAAAKPTTEKAKSKTTTKKPATNKKTTTKKTSK